MAKLIEISVETCKDCPLLHTEVVDHNYYGEVTTRQKCSFLNCVIPEDEKTPKCAYMEDIHIVIRSS